jgi:hypothetical protein
VTACAVLADCTAARQHQPVGVGVRVGVGVGVLGDVGVAASLAKVYGYFAAKSGSTTNTAETAAQNIIDTIHKYYADPGDRQWPKVGLPERRFAPVQLPPVPGRSGYRRRLRVVRSAFPDGAAPVRLLKVPPITE